MKRNINDSLNTAFASAKMEGFQITPKIETTCKMIVTGELSIQDYLHQIEKINMNNNRSVDHGLQS